jgi:hypothetical protein
LGTAVTNSPSQKGVGSSKQKGATNLSRQNLIEIHQNKKNSI